MIMFNDKLHETKRINLPKFGNVLIAMISLRNLLLDDYYEYISKEAKGVDESIFFYIEDENFYKSNKLLAKLIMLNLK